MKVCELLDPASAHILGFEWLKNAVAPVSPYGERHFSDLRAFVAGQETEAEQRAAEVANVACGLHAEIIETARGALRDLPDASGAIARASMGDVLDDPSFLELRRFCALIERIDGLVCELNSRPPIANEAVRAVDQALAIGGRRDAAFYLADEFDAELTTARYRLAREQAELDAARGREKDRAARALGREEIAADEFIVMRADIRGPLPEGIRVLREAPTYLLCALEYGPSSLEALERRDAAADEAAAAEQRVRSRLSRLVREHASGLTAASRVLGELDVLLAAARFAQIHGCKPAIVTAQRMLAFERARFLPLETELAVAGRRFIPLDLELHDAAVLTGPNMGGKSVSLQTCGFIALCAAFGLPVPAQSARSALFDQIAWLGMGREAQIGGLLSSFAREVLELKAILTRDSPRLLILGDEFARTTTPHEGRALMVALLARLRNMGACGMLATHLAGIAGTAGARHFAVRGLREIPQHPPTGDVGQALAALADAMDYTISEVSGDEPARADAVALSELLGIDRDFLDDAYGALSQ